LEYLQDRLWEENQRFETVGPSARTEMTPEDAARQLRLAVQSWCDQGATKILIVFMDARAEMATLVDGIEHECDAATVSVRSIADAAPGRTS
jgi:hypothetical protein